MKMPRNQLEGVVYLGPVRVAALGSQKVSPGDEGTSTGSGSQAVGNTEPCRVEGLWLDQLEGPSVRYLTRLLFVCLFDLTKERGMRKYFHHVAGKT